MTNKECTLDTAETRQTAEWLVLNLPNVDFIMRTRVALGKNIVFFASLLVAMNCVGMLNAM